MKFNRKYSLLASCAIAALPLLASHAYAQAQATDAKKGTDIVEVVVTAQKRSEGINKTPLAITAYTGDTLKSEGVVSVADLQNIAPSVEISHGGFGVGIEIRGVTTTDMTSKGEQGISFNVDGVPIGRPTEMQLAFFDLGRVEVLRGPQGTLYGKSSTGGAINVITNKPANTFQASADAEIGSYNTRRANLMLNVPANDQLAFRFALNTNKRDGYIDLTGGYPARSGEDNASGRLEALWKPTANIQWLLTYTGGEVRGVGSGTVPYAYFLGGKGKEQLRALGDPFPAKNHENFGNISTQIDGEFGAVHATLVGAHLHFTADDFSSSDNDPMGNSIGNGPFAVPNAYNWREYTGTVATDYTELRFSNQNPGVLDWVAGLNYEREDIHESDHNWSAPAATPTYAGSVNAIDPLNQTIHTSSGIFAQATWHVTDALRLTAGARESKDEVNRIGTFALGSGPTPVTLWPDQNGNPCVAPNNCVGTPNNGSESAKKPTWRLGIDYDIAPKSLVYASVATGYKAGGFNDFDPSTGGTGTYTPEQLTAYEVGYKGRLLKNLQYNTDLFYYDYSKDQISSLELFGTIGVIYTRSAPVKISGWENEVHYHLTSDDTIDGSLVFENSHYVHFMAGIFGNVDWSGKHLDKVPGSTANLGYSHVWDLGSDNSLVFHAQSKYSSGYTVSDFQNAIQYKQAPFTRTDLTVTYNMKGGDYYIQGYIKNLENKVQMDGAPAAPTPGVALGQDVAITDPQMMGIRVGAKY